MKVSTEYINKVLDFAKSYGISIKEISEQSGVELKRLYKLRQTRRIEEEEQNKIINALSEFHPQQFEAIQSIFKAMDQ